MGGDVVADTTEEAVGGGAEGFLNFDGASVGAGEWEGADGSGAPLFDEHAGGDAGAFEFGGAGPRGDGGEAGHVRAAVPLGFDGVLRGLGEFGDGAGAEEEFLGHFGRHCKEGIHAIPVL